MTLGKGLFDDQGRIDADLIPRTAGIDLGSSANPFNNLYLSGSFFGSGFALNNNTYLQSENAGNTGMINLLKADASDNTFLNAKVGKVINFGVDNTVVGSLSSTVMKMPAYDLTDGSDKNYTLSIYAAGTSYTLTDTSAAVVFGTTSPVITLNKAGTYLLFSSVNVKYNGCTFGAARTFTAKLRRTNNTAADIADSTRTAATDIITTLTYTFGVFQLPTVLYTTANTDDDITIFADIATVPSAGTLDINQASIVAVRLY